MLYVLNQRQLDMVASCIARANLEGAFADCVVPTIGESVGNMLEKVRANPVNPKGKTLTLYTLTIDSDDGTFTTVSTDEAELNSRAESVVRDEWSTEHDGEWPDDWRAAYEKLHEGSWDTYITLISHDVALPAVGQEDRLADELDSLVADLPETISNEDLKRHAWLGRIILAADDLASRISLEALDTLKRGGKA